MRCLMLFRDASGMLPSVAELRRCGFVMSEAVLCEEEGERTMPLALAAETAARYGGPPEREKRRPDDQA